MGPMPKRRKWKDGVGLVFAPNPVVAGGRHEDLLETFTEHYETMSGGEEWHTTVVSKKKAPPFASYRLVRLPDLYSKAKGQLNGKRVDVRVSRGKRIVGDSISQRTDRLKGPDYGYPRYRFMRFAGDQGFEEIMAYYFADSAIQWLEKLGYTDQRYIFQRPGYRLEKTPDGRYVRRMSARAKPKQLILNVYHTREDNAYYDPRTKQLYFGTGEVSELEDAELLLHEIGHAIQDHICNGFGVTQQAAAMGEGFSDYFAASFFAEDKPEAWKPTVMSWDGVLYGIASNARAIGQDNGSSATFPPALRRLDEPLTAEDFDEYGYSHDNGKIWSATLWDIHRVLGRETADRIIIDSHYELSPHTNFGRGARAIIHADANLFGGVNYVVLAQIFLNRKIRFYGQVISE